MQLAVIEFARHVAGITGATSEEFLPEAEHAVIYLMREWYDYRTDAIIRRDQAADKGGTMRLGELSLRPYGQFPGRGRLRRGRHHGHQYRHRYEFNNHYREQLKTAGLGISGTSPNGELVERLHRAPGPSLVFRVPVPPGIQVPAPEAPPLVPGLHPGLPGI